MQRQVTVIIQFDCVTINYRIFKKICHCSRNFSKQQITFVTCSCMALCHVTGTCSLLCPNLSYTSSYFLSSIIQTSATAIDLSFTLKHYNRFCRSNIKVNFTFTFCSSLYSCLQILSNILKVFAQLCCFLVNFDNE